jgi:hypothetical protein
MPGRPHPLTAPPDGAHTRSMLRQYVDYQRQPKQLLTLPFRLVGVAAVAYLLLTGTYGEDAHIALYVGLSMVVAVVLIDAAWWVAHRQRANS